MSELVDQALSTRVLGWLLLLLVPLVLVSATSFVKMSVVFAALRNALGAPDLPSTLVVTALSLALTSVVMAPVVQDLQDALAPAWAAAETRGKSPEAQKLLSLATPVVREFFRRNSDEAERSMLLELARARAKEARTPEADALRVLWPAFVLTELKEAFQMALLVVLPFLIIDLILANILLALGMTALPPAAIALPFKLLLFVSVDGFSVLSRTLIGGYA